MLLESKCYTRKCKHYQGIAQPDGTEATERPVCKAFPNGIPVEIAYGKNTHSKPLKDQKNTIVYEEATLKEWINR